MAKESERRAMEREKGLPVDEPRGGMGDLPAGAFPGEKPKGEVPPEEKKVTTVVTPPAEEPTKPAARRKLDPELKAMDEVVAVLEDLDPAMRVRVLNWACNRFMGANTGPTANHAGSTTTGGYRED